MALMLTACSGASDASSGSGRKSAVGSIFAMDTYISVQALGDNAQEAVDAALAEVQRLDALLSTGDEDSEIYKLNSSGSAVLSEDSCYLLSRALEISEDTGGAFNPAVYPLMELWGFTTGNYKVPSAEEISALLPLLDLSLISFDEGSGEASFEKEGVEIDFGGIAKGYASSRLVDIFRAHGVSDGMVNLGGNVQVIGKNTENNDWRVGIRDPEDESAVLGILSVSDKTVITSGGYQRYFEEDGVVYQHILDPATGYPAESGLSSVTIVSDDGTLADALATALFVMGEEQAADYWRSHSGAFDAVLATEDGRIFVTEGIAQSFQSEGAYQIIAIE